MGITLPPLRFGLGVAAGVEGEAPFQDLGRSLAQVVDHPVEIHAYSRREDLVQDLERGRVAFAILSCPGYQVLSRKLRSRSRILGALVLAGRRHFKGVLTRLPGSVPRGVQRLAAVPSESSWMATRPELTRRRLRPRPARGSLDALDRVLQGEVGFAMVTDSALEEARRQGIEVEELEEVARTPPLPFEAFLVAPSVARKYDPRIQALLLASKERSPGRVSVEWRVLREEAFGQECAR